MTNPVTCGARSRAKSGAGAVFHRLLMLFNNACLTKHCQQPPQCFRIASANPLLSTAKTQKSIHDFAVQSLEADLFLLQPAAEIGDYDDLLPNRVASIALFGYGGRIGVEVATQRTLAQSFNRA
jgi:hypothetical protein